MLNVCVHSVQVDPFQLTFSCIVYAKMIEIFFLLLSLALVLYTLYLNWRPDNCPPGPFIWPFVGIFPQLIYYSGGQFFKTLYTEYAGIYGKVVQIQLGTQPIIVINDLELIKKAFNNPLLCGRPKILAIKERTGGVERGILFNDGDEWAEQRRFTLRHLRDFGFGKTSMESLIAKEVNEFVERLRKDAGKPIATQHRFSIAVLNALWTITSGKRLGHDDPELLEIIAAITRNVQTSFASLAAKFAPALVLAFPKLTGYDDLKKDLSYTYNYLSKYIKERLSTYDGSSHEDFSDAYIREIQKTNNPTSSFHGKRGELTMTAVLQDLFAAGAETTSTTLSWACLYLSVFPDQQDKLLAEIDKVLKYKEPSLGDRQSMPYTESLIMETLRYSSMLPLSLAHRAVEDVILGGYLIKKDSWIMANLYSVHKDPKIWGDPEAFRPERFLNADGSCMGKHEALMAFSYGKRLCLGESLAKNELFMFITGVFKHFTVTWDHNEPKPSLDAVDGIVVSPKSHKLVFMSRKAE